MQGGSATAVPKAAYATSLAGAAVVLTAGGAALAGFLLRIDALKQVLPGLPAMKANTSIGLLLLGTALLAVRHPTATRRRIALAAAAGAALIGALTLAEYAIGRAFGIDEALFHDTLASIATSHPGRMSLLTATSLLLAALGIACLDTPRLRRLRDVCQLAVLTLALMVLLSYLYGAALLASQTQMAPHTAVALAALALALLACRPDSAFRLLWSDSVAGALARRLGPLLVVVPAGLGALRLALGDRGLLGLRDGTTLLVTAIVVAVTAAVGFVLHRVELGEFRRRAAEAERDALVERLAATSARVRMAELVTKRGSWEWDVTTDRAVWSDGMYRLFGLDPATFRNTNDNFLALVHPDDRDRMGQAIARALAQPGHFRQEYRLRRPDGAWIHVLGQGDVLPDADGKARMIYGFVEDITAELQAAEELRRAQDRFQRVFSASPVGIILTRPDGRFIDANRAFLDDLGYTRDEVLAPSFTAYQVWADASERDRVLEHLRDGGRIRGLQVQVRTKQGKPRTVELNLDLLDVGGETVVLTIFQDLTERLRLERQRAATASARAEVERLQRVEAFRRDFINQVSHELGTPMTPILLDLHILDEAGDALPDRPRRALESLRRNVERLKVQVQNTVEAARFQTAQVALELEDVPAADLAREAAAEVAPEAARRHIALAVDAVPTPVRADRQRIATALGHLLGNALKFTPDGGVVGLHVTNASGDAVRFEVKDNGIGLRPDQLAQLWHPYGRVHDPMVQTKVGAGLGLYVTKGIVALHGGEVGAASAGAHKGAAFWFTLPAAAQAALESDRPPPQLS